MTRRLVLASASPARLRLLRDAGFSPDVVVSGVDEAAARSDDAWDLVSELATAKARAVARTAAAADAVVVGCDSMLLLDGSPLCNPVSEDVAVQRWRQMRGRSGSLLTGHCVVDTASGAEACDVADTVVHFGSPTDAEVAAYVASGEPLHVAGAFTLDGRSAPFVDRIDGDPSNVIGLSLPLLRRLLQRLGVEMIDLWR